MAEKPIQPKDLLTEAQDLRSMLQTRGKCDDLGHKVALLGEKFRTITGHGGISLTDPVYHKALQIYNNELLREAFDYLTLTESNPIWYDESLANL